MESTYPLAPPTAYFRTKIFHPNVDPTTGAVCVDTLKRDWKSELTLRDVLVTINCLLVCPNPASALNAEAGHLMDDDFEEFEKRAAMWSRIHASVPPDLLEAVNEAKGRIVGESSANTTPTAAKGKKRRGAMIDSLPNVPEQSENTPNTHIHAVGELKKKLQPQSSLAKSFMKAPHTQERSKAVGLGLDNVEELGTVPMDIDTPSQLPPLRPSRKRAGIFPSISQLKSPSLQGAPGTASFTSAPLSASLLSSPFITNSFLATPTPMTHQTHDTQPPTKRRRTNSLSPTVTAAKLPTGSASLPRFQNPLISSITTKRDPLNDPFSVSFSMPWLNWEKFLPGKPPEDPFEDKSSTSAVLKAPSEPRRGIFRL
jgi:ubiquitin-conjugating enzyme